MTWEIGALVVAGWVVLGAAGGWFGACGDRAQAVKISPHSDMWPTWRLAVTMMTMGTLAGPFAFGMSWAVYGKDCSFRWKRGPS